MLCHAIDLLQNTEIQREELTKWSQSRTLPAGDVFRAKLILALADGWTWARIAVTLRTTRTTIALWKARFEESGIDGLEPRHKGSQPRAATAAVQARVTRRVQQKPPDSSTHWSCRKLAADLGRAMQRCSVGPPRSSHSIPLKNRTKIWSCGD